MVLECDGRREGISCVFGGKLTGDRVLVIVQEEYHAKGRIL